VNQVKLKWIHSLQYNLKIRLKIEENIFLMSGNLLKETIEIASSIRIIVLEQKKLISWNKMSRFIMNKNEKWKLFQIDLI
jgi:hypothetical protein